MAKRLTGNISSQYLEAANRLRSKNARKKIVAYVESYDDILFCLPDHGNALEEQNRLSEHVN